MIWEYKKMINKYISGQSLIIFQLFFDWCMIEQYQCSTLGPLNELSLIYVEKSKQGMQFKINKFQSTTYEKFKQNMNKLVRN